MHQLPVEYLSRAEPRRHDDGRAMRCQYLLSQLLRCEIVGPLSVPSSRVWWIPFKLAAYYLMTFCNFELVISQFGHSLQHRGVAH